MRALIKKMIATITAMTLIIKKPKFFMPFSKAFSIVGLDISLAI